MTDALINVNGDSVQTLQVLFLTTMIALFPSIVIMMTSFMRIVISLSFLRTAMGTQSTPPNNVLVGLALFLTLFIMSPVVTQIQKTAYEPYIAEQITQEEAFERAKIPLKKFMLNQTENSSLDMYLELSGGTMPDDPTQLPLRVIVPAFMTSELKQAFQIGFFLFIPFMLIDIIVSSTLMSMGMIMLPPATISMPFKLLLFISVDGWQLLFSTLARGFH
ncbi:MAG: flagellar type III secretion system pore protein FliP [Butyricicoccus pullicaecorum]|nr:flagellar type III secretion system pore protein FliP [Butyricicoccus pullicaecorum]MDO4668585.1 flagellar type III secretion system pore protein FliP [Butyricicoccus pullicaecorum]